MRTPRARKLSAENRQNLILYWQAGMSQRALAQKYGVSEATVSYHIRRYSGAGHGQTTTGLRKFDADALRQALQTAHAVSLVAEKALAEVSAQLRKLITQTMYADQSSARIIGVGKDPYDASKVLTWSVADQQELDRLQGRMASYPQDVLERDLVDYPPDLAQLFDQIHDLELRRQATEGGL